MLRNQFPGPGKLQIPIIPKFQSNPSDFDDLLLIGFDKTHIDDQKYLDRMVHFFLYDYKFERVWKNPDADIEKMSLISSSSNGPAERNETNSLLLTIVSISLLWVSSKRFCFAISFSHVATSE